MESDSVSATETVEGQNRIWFQEMMEKEEEDRMSALPDCLILEILSRLPDTKYAIRTGILSKRWKHLWTSVTTLIFTHSDNSLSCTRSPNSRSEYVSFVSKTLTQCRQQKLEKFILHTNYDIRFVAHFNNWIRYAISCHVEALEFDVWCGDDEAEFVLDQFIFISSCFTDLSLSGCILNPVGAINWKNVRRLCISHAELDEDLIENILLGSPALETLVLGDCYGYETLDITSKSVKKLVFSGYSDPEDVTADLADIIEINAPNILSLVINGHLFLWKLLLLNVSSVVEADLDYSKIGHYETTREEAEEEMLKGFILSLGHVKELNIGDPCSEALSRLEDKGFVSPSNIKYPSNWFDSDSDSFESEDQEVLLLDDAPHDNEVN